MSDQTVGPTPQGSQSSGGVLSWLGGVFVDPRGTFESMSARTSVPHPVDPQKTRDATKWWLPMIMIAVVSVVLVVMVVVPYVVMPTQEAAIREAVLERGGTEAQVDEVMAQSAPFIMPFAVLGGVIQSVILIFAVGGLVHLLMKMLGGKGTFRHARAVTAYSMLISTLGTVIKLPFMRAKESLFVDAGATLFFRNLEPSDRLYSFLYTGFDIFTLWWAVVLGIGLAVSYRTSNAKGFTAAGIIWLGFSILSMFQQGGG